MRIGSLEGLFGNKDSEKTMCALDMSSLPNETSMKPSKKKVESKKQTPKYKKAPGAPRRFKSAFIFFSTEKHKEIRSQLGEKGSKEKTTNVAKMVSEAWKNLDSEEREYWEDMARRDKERYEVEKSLYDGPWKVPAQKSSKDPNAPKRPMSAFLSYSNSKRSKVKRQNPGLSNAEVSRVLADMWKKASESEKQGYIDEEFRLRQKYKIDIAEWRANEEREKEAQRKMREEMALRTLEAHKQQMEEMDSQPGDGRLYQRGDGLAGLQVSPHTSMDPLHGSLARSSTLANHHPDENVDNGHNGIMSSLELLSQQPMPNNSQYGAYSSSLNDSAVSSLLGSSAFNTAQTLFDHQQAFMSNLQQQQQWAARETLGQRSGAFGASGLVQPSLGSSRNAALLNALSHAQNPSHRYGGSSRYPGNRLQHDYGAEDYQQGRGEDFNHFFDGASGY